MKYKATGRVIHGDHEGSRLGFPTANLDPRTLDITESGLKVGVYAGYVTLEDGALYKAGIVIRPRGSENVLCAEAHLLDFKGDLYDSTITISLEAYIRPYEKFSHKELLKEAIQADIETIRKILQKV